MKYNKLTLGIVLLIPLITASECEDTSDKIQREQTEELVAEAQRQTGMPGITNFTEKKFVKYLYELRDQEGFSTYTYIVDYNGDLHFVCESIGYGIPYSVQYVNPERRSCGYRECPNIPQAEPNGLFMPDALSATWILCSDGAGGVRPVYSEPALLVSPFPLKTTDSYVQQ